jgi:hypothetical protein
MIVITLILAISSATMITRKSDISRLLKSGRREVPLRFVPTVGSKQTLKLGKLSPRKPPGPPESEGNLFPKSSRTAEDKQVSAAISLLQLELKLVPEKTA